MKKVILAIMIIILVILICIAIGTSKKEVKKVSAPNLKQITPEVNTNNSLDTSTESEEAKEDVQESSTVKVSDTGVNSSYLSIIGIIVLSSGIYYIRRKALS